jgi:hypothetical protein
MRGWGREPPGEFVIALAVLLVACGAGSAKLLGVPVHRPVGLIIRATPAVAAKADRRGMRDMADALVGAMKEKGISSYVAEEGQVVPAPRIDLFITRWEAPGGKRMSSATASYFLGVVGTAELIAHAHDVELECTVTREGEATPVGKHAFFAESGEAVASDIVSRVFTDQTTLETPSPAQKPPR